MSNDLTRMCWIPVTTTDPDEARAWARGRYPGQEPYIIRKGGQKEDEKAPGPGLAAGESTTKPDL